MTGSSAAALTGLMFVVITLLNRRERSEQSALGISTFSTPTVLHFCAALFVSALLSAPWRSPTQVAAVLGLIGFSGSVYLLRVMHRAHHVTAYTLDFEDWIWYTLLPFAAYLTLAVAAIVLAVDPARALFTIAGTVIALTFVGIRNAWDIVTYLAIGGLQGPPEQP